LGIPIGRSAKSRDECAIDRIEGHRNSIAITNEFGFPDLTNP
jgi:hypothetical protein